MVLNPGQSAREVQQYLHYFCVCPPIVVLHHVERNCLMLRDSSYGAAFDAGLMQYSTRSACSASVMLSSSFCPSIAFLP